MLKIFIFLILCTHLPNTILSQEFISVNKCPGSSRYFKNEEILIPPDFRAKGHNNASLLIRLRPEEDLDAKCHGDFVSVTVPLDQGKPKGGSSSVPIKFLNNGMVSINHEYYDSDQYCIFRYDEHRLTLSHCKITCAPYNSPFLCIPKCCPLFHIVKLKGGSHECVPSGGNTHNVTWTPIIYSAHDAGDLNATAFSPEQNPKLHYKHVRFVGEIIPITYRTVNYNDSNEDEGDFLVELEETPFRILDNGSLITLVPELEATKPAGECGEVVEKLPIHKRFCIDGIVIGDEGVYEGTELEQIVFLPSLPEDESNFNTIVKAVVVSIGILFLSLTLIMYIIIWPKHNIHGWTVFSFVCSMLIFFITLAIVHITHLNGDLSILNTRMCVTVAILGHFTFLSALSWMSVMNYNFWATFRIMSPSQGRDKGFQRYLRYFSFALGLPTIIVGISVILHYSHLGEEYAENHHGLLPGYGTIKCQIHPCSLHYYLYIPMACMLGFNLVMFSWTIFTLYKAQTASNRQNQSWILFCKLFLIMGISWIFEVLSGFLNWDIILLDILNLAQALGIFCIFTCKRENLLWIYKRHDFSKKYIGPILRWKLCYVAELDVEQTEMTSAEKNRTLTTLSKFRISSGSDN